jgi:hypothetical protein
LRRFCLASAAWENECYEEKVFEVHGMSSLQLLLGSRSSNSGVHRTIGEGNLASGVGDWAGIAKAMRLKFLADEGCRFAQPLATG